MGARRRQPPRGRRGRDALILAGIIAVLLLAVVGLLSAGAFVGGKLSGTKATPVPRPATHAGTPVAGKEVARAQAQATAIVKAAISSGKAIIASASNRARKQARAIIAAAQRKSRVAAAGPTSSAPAASALPPTAPPVVVQPAPTPAPLTGQVSAGAAESQSTGQAPVSAGSSPAASASSPDLSGVPAGWKVVAYNASFGSGPGSAGSISVINRGGRAYSGVAKVEYLGQGRVLGSASAPFSGLLPGQTLVLPLNGPAYPTAATGYHILVLGVH